MGCRRLFEILDINEEDADNMRTCQHYLNANTQKQNMNKTWKFG